MKRVVVLLILVVFVGQVVKAQSTDITEKLREASIDSLLNDVILDDDYLNSLFKAKKNFQFLYWRSNYDSKTFFAGREIGDQQYSLSGQLFYMHSKGIYAGVSGAWYSQLDPGYRTTVLTVGYGNGLKKLKFFRYRLSYDYFLFNNDDPDFEPIYTSGLNTGITLKSKNLGTRMNLYFLLGKETGKNFSWDAYGYINVVRLRHYNKIRLEPQVSLFWGSEAVEYQLSEILIDPLTNMEYDSYYKDEFGLMNIQFQLPLSVKIKNFDFQASYIYNLPQTMNEGFSYPETSFFRISLGYIFSL